MINWGKQAWKMLTVAQATIDHFVCFKKAACQQATISTFWA